MKLNGKTMILVAVALVSTTALAKKMQMMDWMFRAPSISDPSAVDPATIGDILFDTSDSTFKGWDGSSWTGFGSSSSGLSVRSVTSNDTATTADDVLVLSGSSFNETLYSAATYPGKVIQLLHAGTSFSQAYTLLTTGGQTIGGVASGSYVLYTNGERLKLVSDGTNWIILEHETIQTGTYTPTIGNDGTPTNISFTWQRSGKWVRVMGTATTGTAAAALTTFSLPGGLNMDTNFISINNTTANPGQRMGQANNNAGGGSAYCSVVANTATSTSVVYFGPAGATSTQLNPVNSSNGLSCWTTNGVVISIDFSVPLSGLQP